LDLNDIVAKAKAFFYALRHKQTEKVLAALTAAFFAAGPFLKELKDYPQAPYLAYGLGGVSSLWLIFRVWKLATPPPEPPAGPVPSAIKGLFPFTIDDGKLFGRLGRQMELQQLLGLARNDQVAISAVRGESGAGKTSLLRAGLAFTLGTEKCVYWEAVPDKAPEALLYAICSQLPGIVSLASLPEACPKRCVLILDQFEQLRKREAAHAPIFALLDRIAKAPAPHKLSVIVGIRREYMSDWADFEYACGFRAEQMPINLLAPVTAGDALVTLAGEAGFTLDQDLVDNFIAGVAGPLGVSPVDIAIGLLSLANFVQQRGTTHLGLKEYSLAGGAEGLLLSFVQQKLEEIPEGMRPSLLKGIVLTLVNASNNQRIAAGETAAVIAAKAELPESALVPLLARLAHPRVRLLEKVADDRYRLPHERLVPVLRRLAGATLAAVDQLRLLFEGEYARWRETGSGRHLLGGKDLKRVLRHKSQLVEGETAAGKATYLAACQWRRTKVRLAVGLVMVAAATAGFADYQYGDSSRRQQKLMSWGLPPELFVIQNNVDEIDILLHPVNDLTWLRSTRLKKLVVKFNGSRLVGLEKLKGLTSLTLNLSSSQVTSLAGFEHINGLNSLTLGLSGSQVTNLAGLERLKHLSSLALDLSDSQVTNLAGLEQLKGLNSLTLDLSRSQITNLAGLEQLKNLNSLTLTLDSLKVTGLGGLEHLTSLTLNLKYPDVTTLPGFERIKGFNSFTLNFSAPVVISLTELEQIKGLNSLALNLSYSQVASLPGLEKLKGLNSLALDLSHSRVTRIAELEQLTGLTSLTLRGSRVLSFEGLDRIKGLNSLTLDLSRSGITKLAGLEQLKSLTSLNLNLTSSDVTHLAELKQLTRLTSLNLDLSFSQVTSLDGLEQLKGLTSLTLDLRGSQVTSLAGLEPIKGLTSIEMTLPASLLANFSRSNIRPDITRLWIVADVNTPLVVPSGCRFVGVKDY